MMKHEFEELTGMKVPFFLYDRIEKAYYSFGGDKREFCAAYADNANGLQDQIADAFDEDIRNAREKAVKDAQTAERRIQLLEGTVEGLKRELEKEQEWKPFEDKALMSQQDYDRLAIGNRPMTDEEAIDLIARETGFDKEKIRIVRALPVYEINRHGQLRKCGTVERLPRYEATDWNYVAFTVTANVTRSYEFVNDMLHPMEF